MRFRVGYKRLVALWAIVALPTLYYGIPYSGGETSPRFYNVGGAIMWLISACILLLPLISLPFFIKKRDKPEPGRDLQQGCED